MILDTKRLNTKLKFSKGGDQQFLGFSIGNYKTLNQHVQEGGENKEDSSTN